MSLVLVGAGKMGGSMLEGWLAAGVASGQPVVLEPHPSEAVRGLAARGAIRLNPDRETVKRPDLLILGVKPQALGDVAPGIVALLGPGTALLSILAGKTVADLRAALPGAEAVIRAMPNLPASIGRGAIGAFADPATTGPQRDVVGRLLSANGRLEWVDDEGLIDAVTALSGSGPAYLFALVEAMAEAGAASGLPAGLAARLARATVVGAAELLDRSGREPDALRRDVTSPGGTTAAALDVLQGEGGLAPLVTRAVAAARRRAEALSG